METSLTELAGARDQTGGADSTDSGSTAGGVAEEVDASLPAEEELIP